MLTATDKAIRSVRARKSNDNLSPEIRALIDEAAALDAELISRLNGGVRMQSARNSRMVSDLAITRATSSTSTYLPARHRTELIPRPFGLKWASSL
jgi:hypothetical protein